MAPIDDAQLVQRLRTMQIIAAALVLGVLTFGGIVGSLLLTLERMAPGQFIAYVAAGISLLLVVVACSVPASLGRGGGNAGSSAAGAAAPPSDGEQQLLAGYQTRLIARLALLEGGALLNLVAALIERQPMNLALAGGLVLGMLALFPTRGRIESFLRTQRELRDLEAPGDGQ